MVQIGSHLAPEQSKGIASFWLRFSRVVKVTLANGFVTLSADIPSEQAAAFSLPLFFACLF